MTCPACHTPADDARQHCHGRTGRRTWDATTWAVHCGLYRCPCGVVWGPNYYDRPTKEAS